jgi:formylglycine-generating enzyme required for sulfatase activity
MLTGKLPQGLFEMPSLQVKGLDPRYDQIVAKALREDRNLRYASAGELRHDLDAILTQPVARAAASAAEAPTALTTQTRSREPRAVPDPKHQVRAAAAASRAGPHSQLGEKSSAAHLWTLLLAAAVLGGAAWLVLRQLKERLAIESDRASKKDQIVYRERQNTKNQPFTNTLGMKFVPAGSHGVLFSVWETRVRDFGTFVEESGHDAVSENRFGCKAYTLEKRADGSAAWEQVGGSWRDLRFPSAQTDEHPVVCVSYLDAEAFCEWLTKRERTSGKIPAGDSYRLPTDSEWSRAVGGTEFPWGEHYPPRATDGNYSGAEAIVGVLKGYSNNLVRAGFKDAAARTSAVGMFAENRFGLYDMGGNVLEWCSTWYTADLNDDETKKAFPAAADDQGGQAYRVLRGASWNDDTRENLRSSYRGNDHPMFRNDANGFRCVLVVAGG